MFSIFGGTEARRLPGASQFPWREILLAAILVIAAASILYGVNWFVSRTSESTSTAVPAVQQQVAAPVVSRAPGPELRTAPVAVVPLVEVHWTLVGTARNGAEGRALPIPWDQAMAVINPNGVGDGTAFLSGDGNRGFRFTPNKGENWYKLANYPPGPNLGYDVGPAGVSGSVLEREHQTLFMYTQPEPWVLKYWRADVPLGELKEATAAK